MSTRFGADYVRVYFNRAADAPKVWSLDQGPGTAEICGRGVRAKAEGLFCFRAQDGDGSGPGGADVKAPRAWVEYRNVYVTLTTRGNIRITEAQ